MAKMNKVMEIVFALFLGVNEYSECLNVVKYVVLTHWHKKKRDLLFLTSKRFSKSSLEVN